MSRRRSATTGFTLTELLVVIGIAALLIAISIPVAKSITESNHMARCSAQLQQIGRALKMYHLDYQVVPPCYLALGDDPTNAATEPEGPGLEALWQTDYLGNRKTLHCPRDLQHQDGSEAVFYQSYTGRDEEAKTDSNESYGLFNQYKYLSTRGVIDPDDEDYYRQLGLITGWDATNLPIFDTTWHPDDTTIVTWCDWHTDYVTRGGQGQYLVLFWDGSVKVKPAILFTENCYVNDAGQQKTLYPLAAWRIQPDTTLPADFDHPCP